MRIAVVDVAVENGGATSSMEYFYNRHKEDKSNQYIYGGRESNDANAFKKIMGRIVFEELKRYKEAGFKYLCDNYSAENAFSKINSHF